MRLNPSYDEDDTAEEAGAFYITLDKTAKEIADAFDEHGNVWWIDKVDGDCYKYYITHYVFSSITNKYTFFYSWLGYYETENFMPCGSNVCPTTRDYNNEVTPEE